MDKTDFTNADTLASFSDVAVSQLQEVEGGFGGGFPVWGGGSDYDGTSWETDIDGMCYVNGAYY